MGDQSGVGGWMLSVQLTRFPSHRMSAGAAAVWGSQRRAAMKEPNPPSLD